jgi:DNA-directed RNA polymerase specialized sigma24 family protein
MSSTANRVDAATWVHDPAIKALVRRKAITIARLPGFSRSDRPDIEQELWLHLLRKFASYDPSRANQATFASRLVDRRGASIIRKVRARKRTGCQSILSLDQLHESNRGKPLNLIEAVDDDSGRRHTGVRGPAEAELADLRIDVRDITQRAPPLLKKLAAVLSHVPQFAAGQVLGLSRRRTAALVEKLRELFQSAGLELDVQIPPPSRM